MLNLAHSRGTHMPTIHLTDHWEGESRLFFSPNERLLARAPISKGNLVVWDLNSWEKKLQIDPASNDDVPFVATGAGFAPDSESLITCHDSTCELVRWDISTRSAVWRHRVRKSTWNGTNWLDYSSDGKQVIAVLGKRAIILDSATGKKLESVSFSRLYTEPIGVIWRPDTVQVCYVDETERSGRLRFRISDLSSKSVRLSVDLGRDDCPILSPRNRLALIYRYGKPGYGEVWDLERMQPVHSQRIKLPILAEGVMIGLEDRFVAVPFFEGSVPEPGKCALEIWDLIEAKRLHRFERTLSPDIVWSARSPLLVMSHHAHETARRFRKNIALFIDPFAGKVFGHAFKHWAATETYRLSSSGRWFASAFTTESVDDQGDVIPAGTVAVTDLTPILPAVTSTS